MKMVVAFIMIKTISGPHLGKIPKIRGEVKELPQVVEASGIWVLRCDCEDRI